MLNAAQAKAIINKLGGTGTPPEYGIEYFTVGLDTYIKVLEDEYLGSFIREGGSSFKLVVGSYGGGKTHFLYRIREIAWKHGYAVSYVTLSPRECPFDKLELVYKSIMANLMHPMKEEDLMKPYEKGIDGFIRNWYVRKMDEFGKQEKIDEAISTYVKSISGIESSSFTNAVRYAFLTLNENIEEYERILQWLKGEEIDHDTRNRYGITERLDKTTAFRLIRSLAQWIKAIDYSGLILLFDEAERGMSIASSKEKRIALDNLRQIVDECGNARLPSVAIFYAIPDERQLLDERLEVYEALRQRLSGVLTRVNPSGVRIHLDRLELEPIPFLVDLGNKLADIYEKAYPTHSFIPDVLDDTIRVFAEIAYGERYADVGYRRIFVKSIIQGFHLLRERVSNPIEKEEAERIVRDEVSGLEEEARRPSEEEEY